jgi:hypothetical protein
LNVVLNPYPVYVNGTQVEVEGYNINGFTFLKLADVGKCFDSTVKFNETEERIDITSNPKPTIEDVTTPEPVEETIETNDFYIEKIDVADIYVIDPNGTKYKCIISYANTFTKNKTTQGYWKDGYLFLKNKDGKFISGSASVINANIQNIANSNIKSKIDSDFEGFDYGNIYELRNGQIWKQVSYAYKYKYIYSPDVLIYKDGIVYKMVVEGMDKEITVEQLK